MAAIDPARIRTSQDLAEQLAVLSARYPHGVHHLAAAADLSPATVHALITGRTAVPRAGTLESFVETCGQDPVPWLAARARLVEGARSKRAEVSPDPDRPSEGPLGRVIGELDERDALALGVHQAFAATGMASGAAPMPVLPPYLDRAGFDDRLREAVTAAREGSRLVMVIGDSSTGKTRACWEAIRAELPDWRVWHPLTPERLLAVVEALRTRRVAARSVIWLNEAQFYLQPQQVGELVAAELQALLADDSRGPVLVLGSMWPEFRRLLTTTPQEASAPDPHRAARALLDRGEEVTAPACFTPGQLTKLAAAVAADPRLATAAKRARGGQINQELAGAPELLRRYQQGGPAVRAVLWAAMDARRLGHGPYLPEPLLQEAAPGYLDDHIWDQVASDPDWFIAALDELTATHRRLPGPLIEHRPRPGQTPPPTPQYRLADYLEQHGRTERIFLCPPATFWNAAAHHARTPEDQAALGKAAEDRWRLRHADHLYRHAADTGDPHALSYLAKRCYKVGDHAGAERLARQAADAGNPHELIVLASQREGAGDRAGAERLARQVTDAGNPEVLRYRAALHERAGNPAGAERLAWQAADAGSPEVLLYLADMREQAGDRAGAEQLAHHAARAGHPGVLMHLARRRERAGDRAKAEQLCQHAVDAGHPAALTYLAHLRERAGDPASAEQLAQHAVDAGHRGALMYLAHLRERAGDPASAEQLAQHAVDAGHRGALMYLAHLRERAGDPASAEQLAQHAADARNTGDLMYLADLRERAGDRAGAEQLAQHAAGAGHPGVLMHLAILREQAGDPASAEQLYRQAIDAGNPNALWSLADLREQAGDPASAEQLYRQAIDAGNPNALWSLAALRHRHGDAESSGRLHWFGLDADGEVEDPWE
ncbi:tetratricopeptide repeat protein [Actinomadura oligospora]|uniref:tetratricopeptide repeat protein n=1 Tax=Actinomadura oligospora TaxID=111804 RepID=UPI0012FCC180|nr:tetratricopeptide repeat protein [Actinomadura oligospora]